MGWFVVLPSIAVTVDATRNVYLLLRICCVLTNYLNTISTFLILDPVTAWFHPASLQERQQRPWRQRWTQQLLVPCVPSEGVAGAVLCPRRWQIGAITLPGCGQEKIVGDGRSSGKC